MSIRAALTFGFIAFVCALFGTVALAAILAA